MGLGSIFLTGVKEVVESIHRGNKGLVLFSYLLTCSVLGNLYYLPICIWQCKIPLTDRPVGFAVIIICPTSKFCVSSSRKCTMKHQIAPHYLFYSFALAVGCNTITTMILNRINILVPDRLLNYTEQIPC